MLETEQRIKFNNIVMELPELKKELRFVRLLKFSQPVILGVLYLTGIYIFSKPLLSFIIGNYLFSLGQFIILAIFLNTFKIIPKETKMGLLVELSHEQIKNNEQAIINRINLIYNLLRLDDEGKLEESSFYDYLFKSQFLTREAKVKKYIPK